MELKNFLKLFREFPQIDQTAKVLSRPNSHIHWKGHVGSSMSISAIAVAEQTPGHHVFILNDKEEEEEEKRTREVEEEKQKLKSKQVET